MENEKLNTPQNPPLQQTAVIGCALIDLEFTGLDNSIIDDNEIIELDVWNCFNKEILEYWQEVKNEIENI